MLTSIHRTIPLALAALPCIAALATPSYKPPPTTSINIRRQSRGLLFDILNLPVAGISIREINISLITFQDEVFDISNISIFGTVNDGSVNCTSPEPEAGDEVLVGPARVEPSVVVNVDTITVSLITFGDEVLDISNISIFGDVNDVGCD